MKFYTAKVICIELGITRKTLNSNINKGLFPPYEKSPKRLNGVGWFENTFEKVNAVPRKVNTYNYIKLLQENERLKERIMYLSAA